MARPIPRCPTPDRTRDTTRTPPRREYRPRERRTRHLGWLWLIPLAIIALIWLNSQDESNTVASSRDLTSTPPRRISPIKLQRAVVCLDVVDREPRSISTSFDESVGEVYCWTNVRNGKGRYINHTYYHEGRRISNIQLDYIRNNSRWRTWSRKKVSPGNWNVKITDDAGILLEELSFRINRGYSGQKSHTNNNSRKKVIFKGPPKKLQVFSSQSTSQPIGSVDYNNTFWLLEKSRNGEWAKISLLNGKTGWIKLTYENLETGRRESIVFK